MRFAGAWVFILGLAVCCRVDAKPESLILNPRSELIQGKAFEENRILLKTSSSGTIGPFQFYAEGFAEFNSNFGSIQERRLDDGLFLQEAYLEYRRDAFFAKLGKQSLRWSEMWVLPSLDIWTGRRWNRLLFDPQAEQFEHSTGLSVTWAGPALSLDAVVLGEAARSSFPEPLPEKLEPKDERSPSGGLRLQSSWGGAGFSFLLGKANYNQVAGASVNYAFDHFVPKLEAGRSLTNPPRDALDQEQTFAALGTDVFVGNWTFQPQATWSESIRKNLPEEKSRQVLLYLGLTWAQDRHNIQAQAYKNRETEEAFLGLIYGYRWRDWLECSGFVQNYEGGPGTLFGLYEEQTGGSVIGIRFDVSADVLAR